MTGHGAVPSAERIAEIREMVRASINYNKPSRTHLWNMACSDLLAALDAVTKERDDETARAEAIQVVEIEASDRMRDALRERDAALRRAEAAEGALAKLKGGHLVGVARLAEALPIDEEASREVSKMLNDMQASKPRTRLIRETVITAALEALPAFPEPPPTEYANGWNRFRERLVAALKGRGRG